jgi:hypothetical protein
MIRRVLVLQMDAEGAQGNNIASMSSQLGNLKVLLLGCTNIRSSCRSVKSVNSFLPDLTFDLLDALFLQPLCSFIYYYCVAQEMLEIRMNVIEHKIVVMSGKGGVGKSSVACQLAGALALKGNKVFTAIVVSAS